MMFFIFCFSDLKLPSAPRRSFLEVEARRNESGLSIYKASFFMVAQMAGAGFLALPRGIADTGKLTNK